MSGIYSIVLVFMCIHLVITISQGCQGGVVPLTGEHVVLFGVACPPWSPPGRPALTCGSEKLLACNSSHTLGNGFHRPAEPSEGS